MRPVVVFNPLGQQQQSGAGAEYGQSGLDFAAQRFEHPRFPQQLALHGAFPAGEDQPVKRTVQVLFLPELENVRPKGCKHPLVFDEGPLQGQYGNAHRSFASFRHQQLDFLLIDADHSLP